jgi:alkaline phosphatase
VKAKSIVATTLALAASGCAYAQTQPPKPKLIVAISVDQFSSDLFNEYRATYTGGLKRLASGVVFPAGYQSHAATETCPGHSAILTGSRPSRTGIIANGWANPARSRPAKDGKPDYGVYCAEDTSQPNTNSVTYVVSAGHLKVPTLGDRLKAVDPATQVVAVSGKDRGAVMMGGAQADLTLWWDGKGFSSYVNREVAYPAGLAAVNARAQQLIAKPPAPVLPKQCATHSRAVGIANNGSVGTLQPRKAGDARALRASTAFDALTLDAALSAFTARKLGQGKSTDVLAISFSATDYIGHSFGTSGAEMCNNIAALDVTLGRLFAALDRSRVPYAVVLTADHGGHDLPERNDQNGLPEAQRAEVALMPQVMGAALAKKYGLPESALIGDGPFGDIYFSRHVAANPNAAVIRQTVIDSYRKHPQVAAVFTKEELIATPAPSGPLEDWPLIMRAKASFDPERSGDFVVFLKPFVTPIPSSGLGYVATHGSPWGYDRRVPILFWWKGIAPFEQPNGVEVADILPSIAPLLGLSVPSNEIDGRCVDLIAGPETICR